TRPPLSRSAQPEIDGTGHPFGPERQMDFGADPRGLITGEENFLNQTAILTRGLGRFLASNASSEMRHLLREAIIPKLFEHRPTPAFGRGCFFDGVPLAVFAVGRKGIAHMKVGISHSTFSINLDAIFHPATAGPAVLDDAFGPIGKIDNADAV